MAENVQELRPKLPDSEKVTVNLGFVDLGRIDLMVRDGFYANRADFIRTAVRNQLDRFHLVLDAIHRVPGLSVRAAHVAQHMRDRLIEHRQYILQHGDDPPEIKDWKWKP